MARRLTVLAGSGPLVGHVVGAALTAGDAVQVIAFAPQPPIEGARVLPGDLGDPAAAIAAIAAFASTHLVLAGAISLGDREREQLAGFAAGAAAPTRGDAALSALTTTIERLSGAEVMGVHEIAADLLAPAGPIAGPGWSAELVTAARFALGAARAVGAIDLGQAVVTAGRRVIAAEDVGGTDELLARVAQYRLDGRAGDGHAPLILAKAAKPQQPMSVDLPAIGPNTVSRAADAGIGIIVVEAGRTLLLERPTLIAAAERHDIGVAGLSDE